MGFAFVPCLFATVVANACDLSMTIRGHSDRLMFGDPLFVQVTITNRSDKPVAGVLPSPDLGSLEFVISEPQGHLSYMAHSSGALAGPGTPGIFEPDKPHNSTRRGLRPGDSENGCSAETRPNCGGPNQKGKWWKRKWFFGPERRRRRCSERRRLRCRAGRTDHFTIDNRQYVIDRIQDGSNAGGADGPRQLIVETSETQICRSLMLLSS